MSVLEFIASIVSTVVSIPVAIVVVALIFRRQLRSWFAELPSHIRLGSSEIKWERTAASARFEMAESLLEAGKAPVGPAKDVEPIQDSDSSSGPSPVPTKYDSTSQTRSRSKNLVPKRFVTGLDSDPKSAIKDAYLALRDHMQRKLIQVSPHGGKWEDIADLALAAASIGVIDESIRYSIYEFGSLYRDIESGKVQASPARANLFIELGADSRKAFDIGFDNYVRRRRFEEGDSNAS